MLRFLHSLCFALFTCYVLAQYPPKPQGITIIKSLKKPGASLSYKETYICEITPGVKGFSGYFNLPSTVLGTSYNTSTFFWYFEARNSPKKAPLAIYLAGGPGQSSLFAATGQGGPCYVERDSRTTRLNPWAWNTNVNVLYLDNPAQTGFSYDALFNGTINEVDPDGLTGFPTYTPEDFKTNPPFKPNATFFYGTVPSQDPSRTANSSVQVAHQIWQFAQVWLNEFPQYRTSNSKISIWTHSWGGFYGPSIVKYFLQQNAAIGKSNSNHGCSTDTKIPIDTLGLIQGCVDSVISAPYYPQYAYNNTYGLQLINKTTYQALEQVAARVQSDIRQCRILANNLDPQFNANNQDVNDDCEGSLFELLQLVLNPSLGDETRSGFDIAQLMPDPYPYGYQAGYFNQRTIQQALGVPLNFSAQSNAAAFAIEGTTGDGARANITNLDFVVQNGVKVAMIHGDRDLRCNWLAGENVSLSVDFPGAASFRSSGYANIITNSTYTGGVVRQTGQLSFSRVFEAGHYVHGPEPHGQPETFFRIFNRVLSNVDVATGKVSANNYHSHGPHSSFSIKNVLPAPPPNECNIWQAYNTCNDPQYDALKAGTAVIKDYIVVRPPPGPFVDEGLAVKSAHVSHEIAF